MSFIELFIVAFISAIFAILLGGTYMEHKSEMVAFESVRTTAIAARQSGDILEGAAFRAKIAEQNSWLAKAKYWNSIPVLELLYPDEIDALEPIQ